MTTATVTERKRGASNWIPIASFFVALLMAVFVLPTILRQSPPQTNQTAQLSPDAPQNNQQSLVQALNRGTTSTAGAGAGKGAGAGGGVKPPPPPVKAQQIPSSCQYGYGNPPRQTFSVYSAPCAPAFSGDNGGATAPGVTATEIRMAQYGGSNGPVTSQCGQDSTHQLTCDWQAWINSRYQLYGRQMHIYNVAGGGSGEAAAEAGAVAARSQNMFGALDLVPLNGSVAPDSVGQKLVTWTYYRPNSFYRSSAPYAWSWHASNDRIIDIGSEMVCKQLAGKPPSFNEHKDIDPSFHYDKPRVFGAVVLEEGSDTSSETMMKQDLARCGVVLKRLIPYTIDSGGGTLAAAMTQMRNDGVTTILDFGDQLSTTQMAATATQQQYFPEWVAFGTHNLEQSSFDESIDPNQWRHAIGFFLSEIPRQMSQMDWYIAACQVDPNCANLGQGYSGEGPLGTQSVFDAFLEMANGFQLAGPHLTPQAYQRGLQTLQRPPDPAWAVGGSFQDPDPWSFEKYASFVWWNSDAIDPVTGGQGAWVYVNDAHRYTTGQVPTAPLPFFKSGILQAPSG